MTVAARERETPEHVPLDETRTTILSAGTYQPEDRIDAVEFPPAPQLPHSDQPAPLEAPEGNILAVENGSNDTRATSTPRPGLQFNEPITFSPVKLNVSQAPSGKQL